MKTSDKLLKAFQEFRPHIVGHNTAMELFLEAVNEVAVYEKAIDDWHEELRLGLQKIQSDKEKTIGFFKDFFKEITEDLTGPTENTESKTLCEHKNTTNMFCGGSEYEIWCHDCGKLIES